MLIMKKIVGLFILFLSANLVYAQLHWEAIILPETEWHYLPATSEPPSDWMNINFDDSAWQTGIGGIGYADGDDATIIDACNSLYIRKKFNIQDVSVIEQLILAMDYDDAFVAYINGSEIARSANIQADPVTFKSELEYDHEAMFYQGGIAEQFNLDKNVLQNGDNILAIQVLNRNIGSSDMTAIACLLGYFNTQNIIFNNPPDWFKEVEQFTDSNLPIVVINTNNQQIMDKDRIVAHMGVIDNPDGIRNNITDLYSGYYGYISIETRGQSTQMFPKKAYALETQNIDGSNNNVELMGMPKENDWILYAPYSDKSLIRNALTFELYRKTGNYCSRTAFCEVVINGEYRGLYMLMEKIKRDNDRLDIGTLNPDEISGNDITGGYIFKVDKIDYDYVDELHGWTSYPDPAYPSTMKITYQYNYPDEEDIAPQQREYLKDFVLDTEEALIHDAFAHKQWGYNKFLNVSSFVDFMLINEITKEVDKYKFSSYFYKMKESKGNEIYAGPIWDFNLGYGNVNYWNFGLSTEDWLYEQIWDRIFWWDRLMQDDYFYALSAKRWNDLRKNEWSDENIINLIDSLTTRIDEAKDRNFQRWDILGKYIWPNHDWQNNTYADEVNYVRNFILQRVQWMDNALGTSDLQPAAFLNKNETETYQLDIELADDYFEHEKLKAKYFTPITNAGEDVFEADTILYRSATQATIVLKQIAAVQQSNINVSVQLSHEILCGFISLITNPVSIDLSTGIETTLNELNIYAFENRIFIRCSSTENIPQRLDIINTQGQLLKTVSLQNKTVNEIHPNLPAGMYFVRAISGKYTESKALYLSN